jgi:hypothetical protein
LEEIRRSFLRRHPFIAWTGIGLAALVALALIATVIALHHLQPFVHDRIVSSLQDRFHARVELDGFKLSLRNGVQAEGKGLRIWPPAQVEGVAVAESADRSDPLISLGEFRFRTPLRYAPGKPVLISLVELKGLDIHIPPRSHFGQAAGAASAGAAQAKTAARVLAFALGKIVCTNAHLVLETSKPGKLPLDFAIARFELTPESGGTIQAHQPMRFKAELTNPKPVGLIHTNGTLGPWNTLDPGESPMNGDYTFDHADLATFKGIAGILSSTGKYQGTLRDLNVDGDTDTPDFQLPKLGNPMPLHTHFHARVDATNGDTWLEPVDAVLGHSHFTARGQVVRVLASDPAVNGGLPSSKGHDIDLDINIDSARMEDFLYLTTHSTTPLLTGALTMKAKLHIPPGKETVHKRIQLKGAFDLDQVHFTSDKIQDKITQLSLRGEGKPKEIKTADPEAVRSTMVGNFQMAAGVITLPALTYTVPGAAIDIHGTYGVDGGVMNFEGVAKLQASVSQMIGGWKGFLLKPADRIFRKDGVGTEVPIHITGTRKEPKFGIDFNRLK